MTMAGGPLMNVVRLYRKDVMTQLHVEEALFRSTSSNWLVINDGVKDQSIVLGISGKPEVMVHEREARDRGVPLIKRFTGGGTVVVDEDTVMMSIIVNGEKDLPHVGCFPRQIMEWCEGFLSHHMTTMFGDFRLREHGAVW
jgi:lipoate-protein ligase A